MKLRRSALIFGNAVLFAGVGCSTDDSSSAADSEVAPLRDEGIQMEASVTADAMMNRDGEVQAPDSSSEEPDVGAADANNVSDSQIMADGGNTDAAVTVDSSMPADMMTAIIDMALPGDAAPPVPDQAPPANACDEFRGARCNINQGCCDNGQVVLTCVNGALDSSDVELCQCGDPGVSGRTDVFCAVPGFVGIAHAGRVRKSVRSLRALLLA